MTPIFLRSERVAAVDKIWHVTSRVRWMRLTGDGRQWNESVDGEGQLRRSGRKARRPEKESRAY